MDFASRSDQIDASQRTAALCRKFSEITTPTFGVVIDDKGAQQPMSGIRLAAHWRERERASPRMLVRALEAPDSIAALEDQMPTMHGSPEYVEAGGLMSYGPNLRDLYRRAALLPHFEGCSGSGITAGSSRSVFDQKGPKAPQLDAVTPRHRSRNFS